jgi:hypothetical protein
MRSLLIGSVARTPAPTPWEAARLLGLFRLRFVSRVFSYLPDSRKVVRTPFVSM